LSSKTEEAELYFENEGEAFSSLYPASYFHKNINLAEHESIKLESFASFCQKNSIEKINFMKLDVEGHELEILKGAQSFLESKSIDIIQFEHGLANLISRCFIRDFFLVLKGYRIYRVIQDGLVPLGRYHPVQEIFDMSTNYVAVRESYLLPELI